MIVTGFQLGQKGRVGRRCWKRFARHNAPSPLGIIVDSETLSQFVPAWRRQRSAPRNL